MGSSVLPHTLQGFGGLGIGSLEGEVSMNTPSDNRIILNAKRDAALSLVHRRLGVTFVSTGRDFALLSPSTRGGSRGCNGLCPPTTPPIVMLAVTGNV